MAVVSKGEEGKEPMTDAARPEQPDEADRHEAEEARGGAAVAAAPSVGFFHIYKPGQGYWTRMGTAGAAALLLIVLAQFMYVNLRIYVMPERPTATQNMILSGSVVAFVLLGAFLGWRYMNKPTVADFLIATESEMKKVNWTSRKDLIGSTKVVILFMFLISGILFVIDIIFGYFFQLITVLKHGPFS